MSNALRLIPTPVCDACTCAVIEEAEEMGLDLLWSDAEGFAREMGADIADHLCDAREEGTACGCACRLHDLKPKKGKRHV